MAKRLFHKAKAPVTPSADPSILRVTLNSLQCQLVNLCDRPKQSVTNAQAARTNMINMGANETSSALMKNPLNTTLSPSDTGIFPTVTAALSSPTQSSAHELINIALKPYVPVDFSLDQVHMAEQHKLLKEELLKIDAPSIQLFSHDGGLTEQSRLSASALDIVKAEDSNFSMVEHFIKTKVNRLSRHQALRRKRNSIFGLNQRRKKVSLAFGNSRNATVIIFNSKQQSMKKVFAPDKNSTGPEISKNKSPICNNCIDTSRKSQ